MDCLRSFNFSVKSNTNVTTGLTEWSVGSENYWTYTELKQSRYNIQGFKNINVYGIDCVGFIGSSFFGVGGNAIVDDWGIDILVEGQRPLIGNNITLPNFYNLSETAVGNRVFCLSKFNNSVKFSSPFESVKYFELQNTYAIGHGQNTLGNVNIYWNLNFVIYYKYEGE